MPGHDCHISYSSPRRYLANIREHIRQNTMAELVLGMVLVEKKNRSRPAGNRIWMRTGIYEPGDFHIGRDILPERPLFLLAIEGYYQIGRNAIGQKWPDSRIHRNDDGTFLYGLQLLDIVVQTGAYAHYKSGHSMAGITQKPRAEGFGYDGIISEDVSAPAIKPEVGTILFWIDDGLGAVLTEFAFTDRKTGTA